MGTMFITYSFKLPQGKEEVFHLEFDKQTGDLLNNMPKKPPLWAGLSFHQCPHCPLSFKNQLYCPLAANLSTIIPHFSALLPYEKIHLDVITAERVISQDATVQAAVGSLMGLVIPTSGCPHAAFFKPMARFHLPLSSAAETIYRSVSMYVMAQYFLYREGQPLDLELKGLTEIYENLHIVNATIAERFIAARKHDASVDAVVQLDLYAMTFLGILEDALSELRGLYTPYFTKNLKF